MTALQSVADVQAFIAQEDIRIIDFKVIDMKGRWHHLSIPFERFNDSVLTLGIGFDGSSYGFLTVEKSDMVFIPDISTGFVDPFADEKTLVFIANIYRLKDGERLRFEDDPRYLADKAEDYLKAQGICDRALFGPEFEFYVLKHAAALMPFTNPSTNSYKRLVPGYEAPVSICYGTANRSAVIRIPGYATEPHTKRFEQRSPDATSNPYLAFTAMIMAAIDGIEHKIDPVAEGYGSLDVNLYKLSDAEQCKQGRPCACCNSADARSFV